MDVLNPSRHHLRVGKSWQKPGLGVVLQITCPTSLQASAPKRLYLDCSFRGPRPFLTITDEKSGDLVLNGNLTTLTRKICSNAIIRKITRDSWQKIVAITFEKGSRSVASLIISGDGLNQIELIDHTGISLIRWTAKGTYTRRKPTLFDLKAAANWDDILAEVVSTYGASQNTAQRLETSELDQIQDEVSELQRLLRKKITRRLRTARKAHEKSLKVLPTTEYVEALTVKAQFLQSYAYLLTPGAHELILSSEQTGLKNQLQIVLDPDKSIGANIDHMFTEAKRKRRGILLGSAQVAIENKNINNLEADLLKVRQDRLDDDVLITIAKRHHIRWESPSPQTVASGTFKSQISAAYKTYTHGHARFLVGKGSRENDLLTKSARSNDYWIHVIGITGSHVIVPFKSLPNNDLTPDMLRMAAILAIHFSKLRDDRAGDVYWTKKHHIRKTKGMPPGLWSVEKSESLFVRYTTAELKEVLNRQIT